MNSVTDRQPTSTGLPRHALLFSLVTAFLSGMGVGIIAPVVPFLVEPFVDDPGRLAAVIGILSSMYAICQFLAAPGLGALSDRFGRRPVLLICLLGSVIGYILFGIGGALWVLFLGRIIDGVTGGNVSTLFAYLADQTPAEQRGQTFGKIGAATGVGFICGPLLGGLAAQLSYAAPLFVGAALTLANLLLGVIYMKESLPPAQRARSILLRQLNPLRQLSVILARPVFRWLLIASFLYAVPFTMLQTTVPVMAKEVLGWLPTTIGAMFVVIGVTDILSQGWLLQKALPRFGEVRVAVGGMTLAAVGYALMAGAGWLVASPLMIVAAFVFGVGDAVVGPAFGSLVSRAVGPGEQGRVQGAAQSIQALARIVGPVIGGLLYARLSPVTPYFAGIVLVGLTLIALAQALPFVNRPTETEGAHV